MTLRRRDRWFDPALVDAKSPYTARHSSGVARWAVLVGTELGLAAEELRDLRRAGLRHDIGKLAVSNRVLDKRGPLSPEEVAAIREHPRHTQRILERVAGFRGIVETAASHHERLDGSGYHRGLTAAELGRPARILAVADVYEALTADGPYREALPRDMALAVVGAKRGTGLCAGAVDALAVAARREG
jgi:HD-GYP domain-containing protein (c-di-GMP phosphodiesterase class II)